MSVYLDTSVIVSLFAADEHSARAEAWLMQGHELVVSQWVAAEFSSALSLQKRRGRLTAEDVQIAEQSFDRLLESEFRVEPVVSADIVRARNLVVQHEGLRAPDALHLAIVERIGEVLATFDQVLERAAIAAGIETLSQ